MSLLGHPVCHLGLNWCIFVRIIYFSSISYLLVLSVVPFGKQNKVNNAFKYFNSHAFKNQIFAKMALRVIIWDFGDIVRYFYVFIYKMFLFAITAYFLPFPDKNLWFHLKEEGKELLGMLRAALTNNNGYYVLYLFLCPFQIINCYF